jgi:hypothetical protein
VGEAKSSDREFAGGDSAQFGVGVGRIKARLFAPYPIRINLRNKLVCSALHIYIKYNEL